MARAPVTAEKILKVVSTRYSWNSSSWRLAETLPVANSSEYILKLSVKQDVLTSILDNQGAVKVAGHTIYVHCNKTPLVPQPFHEKRKPKAKK